MWAQLAILAAVVLAALLAAGPARTSEPARVDGDPGASWGLSDEEPYQRVDHALRWLTRHVPRHPVQARPAWRHELAAYIVEAAHQYDLPPLLVVAVVWCESSARVGVVGSDRPSRGLMQLHGMAADGCDLTTAEGQLLCGARWLRRCIDDCLGTVAGGLASYGNGGECWPKHSGKSAWQVWRRLRLWGRLEEITR